MLKNCHPLSHHVYVVCTTFRVREIEFKWWKEKMMETHLENGKIHCVLCFYRVDVDFIVLKHFPCEWFVRCSTISFLQVVDFIAPNYSNTHTRQFSIFFRFEPGILCKLRQIYHVCNCSHARRIYNWSQWLIKLKNVWSKVEPEVDKLIK